MITLAQTAANALVDSIAWTATGGYACYTDGKPRVLFAPGRLLEEKRNVYGRCTLARYSWPDGSALMFRWSEGLGPRVTMSP